VSFDLMKNRRLLHYKENIRNEYDDKFHRPEKFQNF
jgi:hypothetical protein